MRQNNSTVSIPSEHYLMLSSMAAEQAGKIVVNAGNGPLATDTLGTILCEAWKLDETRMCLAMVSYMKGLREEFESRGEEPASLSSVLKSLPFAINEGRFPDVDVNKMQNILLRRVPEMFGKLI